MFEDAARKLYLHGPAKSLRRTEQGGSLAGTVTKYCRTPAKCLQRAERVEEAIQAASKVSNGYCLCVGPTMAPCRLALARWV